MVPQDPVTFKKSSIGSIIGTIHHGETRAPWSALLIMASLFTASCAGVTATLPDGPPNAVVRAYYDAVMADQAPPISQLKKRLVAPIYVEPIGWTVSGQMFATVLSGDMTSETRVMTSSPQSQIPERTIEIVTIHATDLLDWYAYLGESRPGFAGIMTNRVWLDRRVTSDSDVLTATLWHEYQHVRDLSRRRRPPPAVLEARGALRELSTGLAIPSMMARLRQAAISADGHYAEAARRVRETLALALVGDIAAVESLEHFTASEISATAEALGVLAGL